MATTFLWAAASVRIFPSTYYVESIQGSTSCRLELCRLALVLGTFAIGPRRFELLCRFKISKTAAAAV